MTKANSLRRAGKMLAHACRVIAIICLVFSFANFLPCSAEGPETGNRKLIEKSNPVYPALARKNGLTGIVKLRVMISADGRVKDLEVLGGNPLFIGSATNSVKTWKWAPADHATSEVIELEFNGGGS